MLLHLDNPLHQLLQGRIQNGEAEYLPYLGKNECAAWWETASYKEYEFTKERPTISCPIITIFQRKDNRVRDEELESDEEDFNYLDFNYTPESFLYFERLPVDFNEQLFQYRLEEFAFVNFSVKPEAPFNNLYFLKDQQQYVSLF